MFDFLVTCTIRILVFAVFITAAVAFKMEVAMPLNRHWTNDYSDCWKLRKLPDGDTNTIESDICRPR
jgi:hypothetical protein